MNGIHDMGGMDGFGPIPIEHDEPVFHAEWEGRLYAINSVMGAWGEWNIDAGRACMERLDPVVYLQSPYYQRWLYRMENLLVERGMVTPGELTSGKAQGDACQPMPIDEIFDLLASMAGSAAGPPAISLSRRSRRGSGACSVASCRWRSWVAPPRTRSSAGTCSGQLAP